jgi:hypothetical protein
VSPVKYELGFYIPEDDILHSHRHENLKFYMGYDDDDESRICGKKHVAFSSGLEENILNCI